MTTKTKPGECRTVDAAILAAELGKTKNFIYKCCRLGMIPGARKLGKSWLIPRDAADRLMSGEGA